MTLKTLLLGSAAAFAVVGGAQAADLSVAEPVESVKVCDYFGAKYWYIPGTDTCLAIGGNVSFYANIHNNAALVSGGTTAISSHSSNWDFVTKAGLSFDAKSITDNGILAGHVALQATYDGGGTASTVTLDGAWLSWGFIKLGHFGSTFNPDGAYTDDYGISLGGYKSALADNNKIELSWAAAGFALALGIEDPRETWGTQLPASYSMPLITGKITTSQAAWSGLLSAGFVQLAAGTSWGVDGELTFNLGANDHIRINGAFGDNAFVGTGSGSAAVTLATLGAPATNNGYSVFASFQHLFSSTFRGDIDVGYTKNSGATTSVWQVAGDLVWQPASGLKIKTGIMYAQPNVGAAAWAAQVGVRRSW